ncbi:glycoside hydrolase family 108 protein [Rhizobium sp. DKSPLA3]|uniref:Glycoside hydrolase family 108 protein n=1 Tax=Rhizobium quercicola TaxID=2901226 RepID=A0A9X1NTG7_9HYPH|nr:glycoside hydrolase family 108 protein [Rhizobium quercicola]MCD7109696.1 glycoside hydrolase family 108 protein [Rhizobium quercicola]
MARETLSVALDLMFGHEGGYSNAKTDSGGPTKYGITHKTLAAHRGLKSVTAAQVKAMTLAEAIAIYQKSYWTQSGGDLLPAGLDYAAFDFGVNSGPVTAIKKLQDVLAAANVYKGKIDGHIGEQTLAAVDAYPGGVRMLIIAYCDERMKYLRSLGGATGFGPNGRGWTIRVTGKDPLKKWKDQPGVVGNALRLTATKGPAPIAVEAPAEASAKADTKSTGLPEILKKPEAWGPLGGLLSAGGAIAAGSGPLQWALAIALVAGVLVGVWYFVRRVRSEA